LVADWFGASASPCSALAVMHVADGAQVLPAEPGPTGSPVARSHTIGRGPLRGDADGGDRCAVGSARRVAREPAPIAAIATASNSTRPGNGVDGGIRR
jgi:hypothetical protein